MARSERRETGEKDYQGDGIVVHWTPAMCIHSAICVLGLPQVFDPEARPWVRTDGGTPDEIASVVDTCPSHALTYTRSDGGADGPGSRASADAARETGAPVVAMLRPNGPLVVMGPLRVLDCEGNELSGGERHFFCRCGGSSDKPFCDGTHKRNGFTG